jgi:formate hydrogenlyase subunit 4
MIHEAMILEYSGRHLALIEWAAAHCSHRCSCRTALFSIVVRFTTASRSWQLSHNI